MKCLGPLFLLCVGLLSSPLWGQSTAADEPFIVVRYVALSCSAMEPPAVRIGTPRAEVILGSFDSFSATVLNASPSLVLWQTSGLDKAEEMEALLGKTGKFSFPAVIVGVRGASHTEMENPKPLPQPIRKRKQEQSELLQAPEMQATN